MNALQKIGKNIGSLFISQIINYAIGFIFSILIIRYLGVENYGILAFAQAFTSTIGIFADLGLNTLLTREIAKDKTVTTKYLNNIFTIKILLISLIIIFTIIIVNLASYSLETASVIYFMTILLIFSTFTSLYSSLFQAYEKLEYQAIGNILNSILMLIGVLILIKCNFGLILFAFLYALVGGINLVYYLFISSNIFKFPNLKIKVDWEFWKPTIKIAIQFGLIGVFSTIYLWFDTLMLSFMQGNQAVGIYNAAYKIVLVLLIIPTVINAAIFPVMSRMYGSSRKSLEIIVEKYFKLMIMIGVPLGIGTTLLANEIITILFGKGYIESVGALQILIWATVSTFANATFVQLFQSINKQMIVSKITFIGLIFNILLNLIFIPMYSYMAASFNTLLTEFIVAIFLIVLASKNGFLNPKKTLMDFIMILIAATAMALFIFIFKNLNLYLLIVLSAIIYFIVLFLTKTINHEDIEIMKRIFPK